MAVDPFEPAGGARVQLYGRYKRHAAKQNSRLPGVKEG